MKNVGTFLYKIFFLLRPEKCGKNTYSFPFVLNVMCMLHVALIFFEDIFLSKILSVILTNVSWKKKIKFNFVKPDSPFIIASVYQRY